MFNKSKNGFNFLNFNIKYRHRSIKLSTIMQKHQKTKIVACFVRHGQTFDNLNHILAGHQPGKLTETGIEQAYYTGDQLKNSQFDHIYVSDLGRTRETYEGIIAKATHLAAITP